MTDKSKRRVKQRYYPLTKAVVAKLRAIKQGQKPMPASAWRLWSYLVTEEPFGDDYMEMPSLVDILAECSLSKASFYRALALFEANGLFDIQASKFHYRNLHGRGIVSNLRHESQIRDSEFQIRDSESQIRDNTNPGDTDQEGITAKTAMYQTDQTLKQKQLVPTAHPVHEPTAVNREGIGSATDDPLETELQRLCNQIQASGLTPNKTIQGTLFDLLQQVTTTQATAIVRNAISSLEERKRTGRIRNPGGFLNAAIKRGFTSNEAKRISRAESPPPSAAPVQTRCIASLPSPQPPDVLALEMAIDQALSNRDRPWALGRLQGVWHEGWHDQIEGLVATRDDWRFSVTDQGVEERIR